MTCRDHLYYKPSQIPSNPYNAHCFVEREREREIFWFPKQDHMQVWTINSTTSQQRFHTENKSLTCFSGTKLISEGGKAWNHNQPWVSIKYLSTIILSILHIQPIPTKHEIKNYQNDVNQLAVIYKCQWSKSIHSRYVFKFNISKLLFHIK